LAGVLANLGNPLEGVALSGFCWYNPGVVEPRYTVELIEAKARIDTSCLAIHSIDKRAVRVSLPWQVSGRLFVSHVMTSLARLCCLHTAHPPDQPTYDAHSARRESIMRIRSLLFPSLGFVVALLVSASLGLVVKAQPVESAIAIRDDQSVGAQSGLGTIAEPSSQASHARLLRGRDSDRGVAEAAIAAAQHSLSSMPDLDPAGMGWRNQYPIAQGYHALAYDSARGVVVLFGGRGESDSILHYDTWEWDGTSWEMRNPATRPPARLGHSLAYDSARGVVVLFGGRDSSWTVLNDTWEYDGTSWAQSSTGGPSARTEHGMVYDSARGVVVLFGGCYYSSSNQIDLSDTWEWDGTSWVERTPTSYPTSRSAHAMAYDTARGVVVLFGGGDSMNLRGDTWEWDGTNWVERSLGGRPTARYGHAMAYDTARGVVVLFGGIDATNLRDDTWEWDGGPHWVQRSPASHPSTRHLHAMAYDSAREVVVLFGGRDGQTEYQDDIWEWDGSHWVESSPSVHPSARHLHAMSYDSAREIVVLFGGIGSPLLDDTWERDGTEWVQRTPASHPTARHGHAMAYDSARGGVVLFGGYDGSYQNDTWEYNGTNWVQRSPASQPLGRFSHVMAYDSAREVVVLFGGHDGTLQLDDTWEWDGENWIQHSPSSVPLARWRHAMAYDGARSRVVLFGGYCGDACKLDDFWEWNGTNWAELSPSVRPSARYGHAIAYDRARSVIVLFGGVDDWGYPEDTWEWDGTEWVELSPATAPHARQQHALAYDNDRGTVLFGGYYTDPLDDTWVYGPTVQRPSLFPIDNPDGDGDYLVEWSSVIGATAYTLEEDDRVSFASPAVAYQGDQTSFQVSGHVSGDWYYRVKGTNAEVDGYWSNSELVGVRPAAPTLNPIENSDGDGAYLVDWSDETGATSYYLEEDDNSAFTSPTVRHNGVSSQYQVSGQQTDQWYYRVRGSNAGGDSLWSNTESAIVLPVAPVLLSISNPEGNGDYLVDWSDVAGATSYRLEEDDNSAFTSPAVRYTGENSQFPVYGQEAGTWYYRVRASNSLGDSPWSGTEAVTVGWRLYLPMVLRGSDSGP
jgi:hypothetical protein